MAVVEAHHVAVPHLAGDARGTGRRARATPLDTGVTGCVPTGVAMLAMLGALPVGAVAGAWLTTVFGQPIDLPPARPPARAGRHRA